MSIRARSLRMSLAAGFAALALGACAGTATPDAKASDDQASAAPLPDQNATHVDYADKRLWLCRPDIAKDHCDIDLDATVIKADGSMKKEAFKAASKPDIDCFFVYPTVSLDTGWQSDLVPDKMEIDDVKLQFARFSSVCRTFAPVYRQTTLTALRIASGGAPPAGPRPAANVGGYNDVLEAWNWYMANENKGRGVVLIGHSQGAGLITRLIAQEIDGKPVQKQFISALIMGSSVMVPEGKDVGGSFKSVPLCKSESQVGCAINYVTFRDIYPPPPESRFGKAANGMVAACTNPAALSVGKGAPDSYWLAKGFLNGSGGTTQPDWTKPAKPVATPFVKTPGLVTTQCVKKGDFSYLEMHVNGDPSDPRTDELGGEIVRPTGLDYGWGLHLIDVDHSMGDLIRIVGKQSAAYRSKG